MVSINYIFSKLIFADIGEEPFISRVSSASVKGM